MIHYFRIIHLLESDLDYVLCKVWGRDFMVHDEVLQNFHTNQYWGRKYRQPSSSILNKVLTLDIIRYYCENMVIINNDAKACYDRVIPYLTLFMLRRLGVLDSRLLHMDLAMDITFSKQRHHNVFLMDVLDGHFSPFDLEKINRVSIAADVNSLNGRRFLHHIKRGETHQKSKLRWPKQPLER